MNKEPRIRILDIFAAFCIAIGGVFFLAMLHIMAINSYGDTAAVMTTIFIVSLRIYEALLIFAGAGVVIHILRILAWQITTPEWVKTEIKRQRR